MERRRPSPDPGAVPHQVLSAISHELRGPLGVSRGYLRILRTQLGEDDPAVKAVEQAGRATDLMAALLDEVSRYARLARAETRLSPAMTSLAAVLAAAIERTRRSGGAAIDIAVEVPSDLLVWADAEHTAEACAALAIALGRAQTEGRRLTFRLGQTDDAIEVRLLVAEAPESGADARPVQVNRSGAGLGLAVADLAVRLQGGSLEERWADDAWAGYVVRFATRDPGGPAGRS